MGLRGGRAMRGAVASGAKAGRTAGRVPGASPGRGLAARGCLWEGRGYRADACSGKPPGEARRRTLVAASVRRRHALGRAVLRRIGRAAPTERRDVDGAFARHHTPLRPASGRSTETRLRQGSWRGGKANGQARIVPPTRRGTLRARHTRPGGRADGRRARASRRPDRPSCLARHDAGGRATLSALPRAPPDPSPT